MAEFYTAFSCLFDVGTPENAARAVAIHQSAPGRSPYDSPMREGFDLTIDDDGDGSRLWLRSIDYGEPELVIQFVKRCAAEFGLTGHWGFQWAYTCSRPDLDSFRGGAHVLDLATGETVDWVDTAEWLAVQLTVGGDADA